MLKFKVKLTDGSTTEAYLNSNNIEKVFYFMNPKHKCVCIENFVDVKGIPHKYDEVVELSYEVG